MLNNIVDIYYLIREKKNYSTIPALLVLQFQSKINSKFHNGTGVFVFTHELFGDGAVSSHV